MRVLFVGQPGLGHLLPMLPLADALIAADADVTFVTGADVCAVLERRGYQTAAAGVTGAEQRAFAEARRPPSRDPHDGMRFAYGTLFTQEQAPRMLPDLLSVIDREQPDLLIHESAEFATPLAGSIRGVPWIHHSYGIARPREVQQLATAAMTALWQEHTGATAPDAGMFTHAYLDVCPPTLQLRQPAPKRRMPMRPVEAPGSSGPGVRDARETVLVTFGTVFHQATTVIGDIVRAVARLPVDVLATSGPDISPRALEPLPANVRVEQYVSFGTVLPQCAAVVTHGGSGTTLASLAHGVPLVFVPQGADQFLNASQVSAAGAGVTAEQDSAATCVLDVLTTPAYRESANAVAVEIAAMPSADDVAATLRWFL